MTGFHLLIIIWVFLSANLPVFLFFFFKFSFFCLIHISLRFKAQSICGVSITSQEALLSTEAVIEQQGKKGLHHFRAALSDFLFKFITMAH